jgi:hypothetical protein
MRRPGNLSIKSSDWPAPVSRCRPLFMNKSGDVPKTNKKSPLHQFGATCSSHYKGLKNAKAGFVALAVICYALCKLTSKSAQVQL